MDTLRSDRKAGIPRASRPRMQCQWRRSVVVQVRVLHDVLLVFLLVLARITRLHLLVTSNRLALVEGAVYRCSDVFILPLFTVIALLERIDELRTNFVARVHHARLLVEVLLLIRRRGWSLDQSDNFLQVRSRCQRGQFWLNERQV